MLWNRWDEAVASGDLRTAVLDRLYALVDQAGLDEDRVRNWVIIRELVNVLEVVKEPAGGHDANWVTRATTIVKAVQR